MKTVSPELQAHLDTEATTPAALQVRIVEPPTPGQGARRVWSDSAGRMWIAEWHSGQVSMHDPRDGSWRAWKLPGERPRTYSVWVDPSDQVWLTDFVANAIVRFDPATDFSRWGGRTCVAPSCACLGSGCVGRMAGAPEAGSPIGSIGAASTSSSRCRSISGRLRRSTARPSTR